MNLFTGTPIVNLPIESFEIGGYNVEVGLKYNTGSIRVSQTSSRLGLGWHLSTGGTIVRHMKGAIKGESYQRTSIRFGQNRINPNRKICLGYEAQPDSKSFQVLNIGEFC